jgi:hypothetical protein
MQVSTQMLRIRKMKPFDINDPIPEGNEVFEKQYTEIKIPHVSEAERIPDKQINNSAWLTAIEGHLLHECERKIRSFVKAQLIEQEKDYNQREWAFEFKRDGKDQD